MPASRLPPLGPGTGNVTNWDGSTLSVFAKGAQPLQSDCINTVYSYLLANATATVHETSMEAFTDALNQCTLFIQGYDNSKMVCFGAIRILQQPDIDILSSYYGGYGVDPNGYPGYGGGYSFKGILGELCYVYQDPAYSGDSLSINLIKSFLDYQHFAYVTAGLSPVKRIMCIAPTTIPSGTQYDWIRWIASGTGLANYGLVGYSNITLQGNFNFTANPYHNVNSPATIYSFEGV